MRRSTVSPIIGAAVCCLASAAFVRAETPSLQELFRDEPPDSLIARLEPGLGVSVSLAKPVRETATDRWVLSSAPGGQLVATDPATGLVLRQQRRWLSEPGMLLLDTTLTNQGNAAVQLAEIRPADWVFRIAEPDSLRYRPLEHRNDSWYGSTYWTGPDWTRVGKDWHHPGQNTPSIRRFTCPEDGRVTITGRVYKAHLDGDGVRVSILHGQRTVWQAEIEGRNAKGVEPNLVLDVRRGEAIRFAVHKRGKIFCDTTHWAPTITYADGKRFQASASFAATQQGGWSYEMETSAQSAAGVPRLHGLTRGLTLREEEFAVGRSIQQANTSTRPVFVLADGLDRSGVVVVLPEADSCQVHSQLTQAGRLCFQLRLERSDPLKPGESLRLPQVMLAAYRGSWMAGFATLQRSLGATASHEDNPFVKELDYWVMIQADWRRQDRLTETVDSYAAATKRHLKTARQLLAELQAEHGSTLLPEAAARLDHLAAKPATNLEQQRPQYLEVRWLKRQIALANPRMKLGPLLFCKRVPTSYSHLVMQYFGWRARPGGGLFILEKPGESLACRDILNGRLTGGNVLEPRLSYDAKRIVFSYVDLAGKRFDPGNVDNETDQGFYHIYEVNVDGTGLRQLTRGPYDDLMPTYLPDGRIAFCSTRRQGYARCFGGQFSPRWHVYTLHRMDGDGGNIRTLSVHDTNEWFPTVSNTGHLLYARWDYIDRDAVTHQNLWSTRPDGTNPLALWGNATASPHCVFQAQPIPGSSKIIFTASAHHSITGGSIAIVDPTVAVDGQSAITRITPEIVFPEAEGRDIKEYYASPWPLSEKYYLVSYSPVPLVWEPEANDPTALGLYYLDAFGNRELLYRDPAMGSENPCPLVPRPVPPVLENTLPPEAPPVGEMLLTDVYEGLGEVPRGTIKALRIVQIFPKTTVVANSPPIGLAGEENGRAILGTVPVESDGSARFLVPALKPILFQALDENGFAYQTMRTITYVQPGERISCIGCHEDRRMAPPSKAPLAQRRQPSEIEPGELGGRPFSFMEVVQPIFDKHCVKCHGATKRAGGIELTGAPEKGFSKSYWALCGDVNFWGAGTNPENAAKALVPRFGARNQIQVTPPGGMYGALGSRLIQLLRAGHEDVKLTRAELARLVAWIDLNAIFYGVNLPEAQARQLRGEQVPMPEIQ